MQFYKPFSSKLKTFFINAALLTVISVGCGYNNTEQTMQIYPPLIAGQPVYSTPTPTPEIEPNYSMSGALDCTWTREVLTMRKGKIPIPYFWNYRKSSFPNLWKIPLMMQEFL